MRVLVTGASNPTGQAIVRALAQAGHQVRAFGGDGHAFEHMDAGSGEISWYPGNVDIGGQIEPALSERQALVHAATLDAAAPGSAGKKAHAVSIERGTTYARYSAEREQVDDFILVTPAEPDRTYAKSHASAVEEARRTRGAINVHIVQAREPEATAAAVRAALEQLPVLGKQPGRENDAVTA